MQTWPMATCLAACVSIVATPSSARADEPIEVRATQDLSVSRGTDDTGPRKERIIHPKTVGDDKHQLDRFAMIRFDSKDFGKGVRLAELQIQARDDETHDGRYRFRVYGVRDGDKEDEAFTEKDYQPGAEGTLFDNSTNMLDRKQVSVLGTFSTEKGKTVHFSSTTLTAFLRSDTNGVVTLVIIRETESGKDSVFKDSSSDNPPKLVMKTVMRDEPEPAPAE